MEFATLAACTDCYAYAAGISAEEQGREYPDAVISAQARIAQDNGVMSQQVRLVPSSWPKDDLAEIEDLDDIDGDDDSEGHFSWSPCEVCLSSLGGDRFPVELIIEELGAPITPTESTAVFVTFDGEVSFPVVSVTPGVWNGWAAPVFSRATTLQLIEFLNSRILERPSMGSLIVGEWQSYALDPITGHVVERCGSLSPYVEVEPYGITDDWAPNQDGNYAIGAYSWVWSVVGPDDEVTPYGK